jgi:hypothetical protein
MAIVSIIKRLIESTGFASDAEKAEHLAAAEGLRVLETVDARVAALEHKLAGLTGEAPAAPVPADGDAAGSGT